MQQANEISAQAGADQVIVNAATELIMEGGFSAMSMRSLARKAGMQAGSLYYHFPSKVDVLEEVLDSLLQQRLNDWLSIKIRGDDVITQLDAFVSFHVNRVLRYTKEEDLLMLELKNLNGAQRATIFAQDELYTGELISIIKQGVRSGIFRVTDAAVAARALLGLLSGGATRSDGLDGSVKITLTQMSHRVLGM